MPSIDELELVSRYAAGELRGEALRAFEDQLATTSSLRLALERLRLVIALAPELPDERDARVSERLILKVKRPTPWSSRALAATGVCVVLVAAFSVWRALAVGPALLTVMSGPVLVNHEHIALGTQRPLLEGDLLETQAGAAVISGAHNTWLVPENAAIEWASGRARLNAGTALVLGEGALSLAGTEVELKGRGVFSVEPDEGVARVTHTLSSLSSEALMRTGWLKLGLFGSAMAAAGAGATVFMLDGAATVTPAPGLAPVTLASGQRWSAGSHGSPARFSSGAEAVPAPTTHNESTNEMRAALAAAEAEVAQLRRKLDEANQKADFQAMVNKGLHPVVNPNEPQPWPASMPEAQQPAGFAKVLREVKASCPSAPAVADVMCEEPPCMLAIRGDMANSYEPMVSCEAWNAAFGRAVSMSSEELSCDGGASVSVTLISPHWAGWDDEDPVYARAVSNRIRLRWARYRETHCP